MPKNLFIVVNKKLSWYDPQDFIDIGNRVAAMAPDIRVFIVGPRASAEQFPQTVWQEKTLTVALLRHAEFRPPRGRTLFFHPIQKLDQARALMRSGIDVPNCALFRPGLAMPADVWGDYVVLKPANLWLTSKGDVYLFRREKLEKMQLADFPEEHLIHQSPMIAQCFVDTGRRPNKFRALTFCGEPLYVQHTVLTAPMAQSLESDEIVESATVSTGAGEREYFHGNYPIVRQLARSAAAAFPNRPLLGIDIIRDVNTGKLSVLEVNAGGNVWHFSSRMWAERRQRLPHIAEQMRNQLGAFDVAAQALVEATRQFAL